MTKSRFGNLDARRPTVEPMASPGRAPIVARKAPPTPSREGKKALTIYITPETHRELRQMSLDEGKTTQALLFEALDLLARSRDKHPFGES